MNACGKRTACTCLRRERVVSVAAKGWVRAASRGATPAVRPRVRVWCARRGDACVVRALTCAFHLQALAAPASEQVEGALRGGSADEGGGVRPERVRLDSAAVAAGAGGFQRGEAGCSALPAVGRWRAASALDCSIRT
eukprot:1179191-Prorocentrum_minimum.AAC.4